MNTAIPYATASLRSGSSTSPAPLMATREAPQDLDVIVLDDDRFMVQATRCIVESANIGRVTAYTSPTQALKNLDMNNPSQIVLCDLNMPEMDGVEVIRHLGQHGFSGAIIVLSGEDSRTMQTVVNMGRAYQLRLLGFLEKPVDQQKMLRLLQQDMTIAPSAPQGMQPALSEAEIRNGLDTGALVPYYQPQVDAVTRKVVGVEALARWQHPRLGILGPQHFIPLAEQSNLIAAMTTSMLTMALQQLRQWQDAGLDLQVAVNISMHSLNDIGFPDQLMSQAERIGVSPERLILEITESHLSMDMRVASDVLARLCLKRVHLSIDDFGTAYSNMERLRMLPFSELKIDRAFVHGASSQPSTYAILKASAELGKHLGMAIVAEGVENQEDWDTAAQLGCSLIQGYHVARPMPAPQLTSWLKTWR